MIEKVSARRVLVVASLFALYVVWGSTYFGMRVAVAGIPPYLMAGTRYLVAGAILFAFLRVRGASSPTSREWRGATAIGTLLFAGGNGPIVIVEQHVSSGLAAVMVAMVPAWAMMFSALWGERPSRGDVVALIVGFGGVAILASGSELRGEPWAACLLLFAPACWAFASVWSRHITLPAGAMAAATQMLAGGASMLAIAVVRGESVPRSVPTPSLLALAYLIVFGSLVAFSAYGYLLQNTRPAVFTSYAYVNPVVALGLGAAFGAERIGPVTLVGTAVILGGVAWLTLGRARSVHSASRAKSA